MMLSFETEMQSETLSQSSLIDLIKARRASKDFVSNQSISRKDLEEILYAGSLAPSGFNLQPWRFIIVETPEGKDKIFDCAFEQEQIKLIIDKELQLFKTDLSDRNVTIKYSSEITNFIFNKIQFNNFGARQVIKTIQRELQTQVAEKMLDSDKKLNLEISVKDNNICVI